MTPARFDALTARFARLRVGVIGDFSLDRYFDLDPAREETSLETGRPVHNILRVRCQPGAAGNILANAAALGAPALFPLGYCGDDGEGFELRRALQRIPGVSLAAFLTSPARHTFTYTKPLLPRPGAAPEELSRLDLKDTTPLPAPLEAQLIAALRALADQLDVLIVMDQAGVAGCGAITDSVLMALAEITRALPRLVVLADSRHGLARFPACAWKMNAAEFAALAAALPPAPSPSDLPASPNVEPSSSAIPFAPRLAGARALAARHGQPVFITLAEHGIIGAAPATPPTTRPTLPSASSIVAAHVPALPVRGPIDIVGAGDTVTATLALALAADATIHEAMTLAQAAASLVVHQLGTTGTATTPHLRRLLFPARLNA
ncbi:hypothetical protein K0B96_00875 [Horticoccus luteus]|uniref:Carbohydrate kinase PfkB domain-containing protein n=1 Tax=Horticoccus luteus TaxID=2862869 RepID=A0A8F9TUA5_9BACT|nr:PfkB family carbohydrate kinase [Horticoccus luteus]QYM79201.1 hypothetical protein K0B96_00875 [Horticoccus luteus]